MDVPSCDLIARAIWHREMAMQPKFGEKGEKRPASH
jgi:hypothetical protein